MKNEKTKECDCEGCQVELETAYEFQEMGFNVAIEEFDGHLFFIAFDDNDEWVAG